MRLWPVMLLLAGTLLAQTAVNVSGKWVIEGAGRGAGRGGGRGGQTLTLNQVGHEVTGEVVGGGGGGGGSAAPINNEIFSGRVDGTTVSFYIWRGTDKPYKVSYSGTLNAAGDQLAFTITGGRGGGPPAPAAQPAGAVTPPAAAPPTIARRAK